MYGIVLAAALTSGTTSADWGFKHKHHCGCYCGCYGCYGCYSCYGCWKGCYSGCYCSGCYGCWTTCGCYACTGYCSCWGCSCSCAYGVYVNGACYGCYGCSLGVTYACVGCAVPALGGAVIGGTVIDGGAMTAPSGTETIPTPPTMTGNQAKANTNRPATVVVKASKDITLKVNGHVVPRRGDEEVYTSPALTPGRTYSYTFVAERLVEGKPVTETKEVNVFAGRSTVVDFSDFGAVAKSDEEAAPASVTVKLPSNAKLTVNDVAVNVSGQQTFTTPKLEKGKSYFYTVKAEIVREGKTVTETRRVDVAAGKEVTIDFTTSAASTLTASR